jgi:hypothetical protein
MERSAPQTHPLIANPIGGPKDKQVAALFFSETLTYKLESAILK